MKRALLCATAAATMVSAGAVAHAQGGWYGTAKVGAIVDGLQDIDAKSPVANGALDTRADLEVDPVYGIGLGYAYDNGLRLEGVFGYRNVDLDVPDTLVGTLPAGRVGPNGAGSTRVTDLMFNAIQDFKFEGSKITPYLGVGAGAARVNSRAASTFLTGPGSQANGYDDSATGYALNAMAGFGIKVSEQMTLDLGYTYLTVPDLDMTGVDGNYETSYQDHSIKAGIRWQFAAPPPPAPPPPPPPPPPTTVDQTAAQTCTQQQPPFVVYFEWDRSDLTAANRDTINAAVARAKAGGCSITLTAVEGHTDSSGKPAYNDKLSQRRADVVKTALLGAGVADTAIKTAAKGESEPAEPRPDGTREPLNRRAEVQITIGR